MPIPVQCDCGRQLMARDDFAGRRTKCPDCGRELIVPSAAASPQGEDDPQLLPRRPGAVRTTDPEFDRSPRGTSGKATASLVLGLLSFCLCLFTGIPSIIFGIIGLREIRNSKGRLGGEGMAITGMVLSGISMVLVVPGVLIALLLPAVQAAREAARSVQSVNNMKQLGIGILNYESSNGHFPASAITAPDGTKLLSWRVAILPYVGEEALYRQFKLDEPWDSPNNRPLLDRMPKVFQAATSNPNSNETVYQVFVGPGTAFEERPDVGGISVRDVTDGLQNTIAVVEATRPVPWTKPDDLPFDPNGPLPPIGGIRGIQNVNISTLDGSVRRVQLTKIDPRVIKAMITRAGNEVVSISQLEAR